MMVMLFLFYFAQFDHAIDERANTKGLFLIYSHYPIFISLFVVTVSMGFLVDSSANHLFVTAFFLAGIGMFQAAVLANGRYNKDYLRYTKSFCMTQAVCSGIHICSAHVGNTDPRHCHWDSYDGDDRNSFHAFLYDPGQKKRKAKLAFDLSLGFLKLCHWGTDH